MNKLFLKYDVLLSILLVLFILIGFTKISFYDYYEVPEVETDFLSNTNAFTLYANQVFNDDDCDCNILVDIYKSVDTNNTDLNYYIAVVSVDIDMNDDLSTQTLSEFNSIESVSIQYDMSSENNYNLANYTSPSWGEHKQGINISFSWNNFIGKKAIADSYNKIGYFHTGTSTAEKVYKGNFTFYDYTKDSHIKTMIIVETMNEENFSFTFDYRIEMKHTELSFLSIKQSNITGDWKSVTVTQSI